jgi:hypothetical protein
MHLREYVAVYGALAADAITRPGILPYLRWLMPWVLFCVTVTMLRVVWQISEPTPMDRYWKFSMIAMGLGLGFLSSALMAEFFPGRHGLQVCVVGSVALFPDRALRILVKVFDQLEVDPFGIVKRLRGGDPSK